jgi:hypothetical protein
VGDGAPAVGARVSGGGMNRTQGSNADATKPEAGVEAFLKALVNQDKEGLAKAISSRATGDLAKLRKGEADAKVATKLTETYGSLYVIKSANATRGDERYVVLSPNQQADNNNKKGLKQIRVRLEEGTWKVVDFK